MNERYIIPSLDRAFRVLELLEREPNGMSLAELKRRSGIPKSTLFRILVTLLKHHGVVLNEEAQTYRLGSRLWELGTSFLQQSDLYHASSRHMKRLAEASGETVFMGTLEEGEVIYLRRMESPRSITVVRKLQQRVPAHCTATGVAMLAFLPPAEVDAILEAHGLTSFTKNTVTDMAAFRQHLTRVRSEGVAIIDGEYNAELLCISAPVFDHTHRPRASLTIAMLSAQMTNTDRLETLAALVREGAQAFSRDMGYARSNAV